jgi:hypothetical protein
LVMGRLSRAEEAKQRAAKRQLQFGSAETNAAKPNHEGLIDDAGRMIGSGILRDGVLYTEITPGGGRATGRGRRGGVTVPTAAISLAGGKLFPVVKDGKVQYVERGALAETKQPERETPAPDPDPDPDPEPLTEETLKPPSRTELESSKPKSWSEYETWLNESGIQLRGGYESTALPGLDNSKFKGVNNKPKGTVEGDYVPTGEEQSAGAQQGTSPAADVGDQGRALRMPKGARQQEMFMRQNPNFGQEDNSSSLSTQPSAISARSRAFLDAPSDVGVMGVMRRTNAAQNIMRQGNDIVYKDEDGNNRSITQEGYNDIVQNQRNAQTFKDDFLNQYAVETPSQSQSPDSINPIAASFTSMPEKIVEVDMLNNAFDTEAYGKAIDSQAAFNLQNSESFVDDVLGDGREPLMRSKTLKALGL